MKETNFLTGCSHLFYHRHTSSYPLFQSHFTSHQRESHIERKETKPSSSNHFHSTLPNFWIAPPSLSLSLYPYIRPYVVSQRDVVTPRIRRNFEEVPSIQSFLHSWHIYLSYIRLIIRKEIACGKIVPSNCLIPLIYTYNMN